MGQTTFSGPVKVGTVKDTTGTAVGKVANLGTPVLQQRVNVTQSASAADTGIVIPAGYALDYSTLNVTAAWTGASSDFQIGYNSGGTDLCNGVSAATIGQKGAGPSTAGQLTLWTGSSTVDRKVYISSANAGTGVGILELTYKAVS